MAIIERLQAMLESFQKAAHGSPTWPPPGVEQRWEKVETYRRYFENDPGTMLQHAPIFNRSAEGRDIFTPVGLAGEICRYSADLMSSAQPDVTFSSDEELFEKVEDANGLDARLVEIAEYIAVEGRGALRVIRDSEVADVPLITHVHEDQILWNEKHGGFVLGGAVVVSRVTDATQSTVYRLVEEHKKGRIERKLYKGKSFLLGTEVALNALDEFKNLLAEEETGLDTPTLIRWDNVSGGKSDLAGQEAILDKINEEYSRGIDKSRKSTPVTFASRELADDAGGVDLWGIVLGGQGEHAQALGEALPPIQTHQPDFKSQEVIAWIDFLIDSALMFTGYSKASYGRDQGGSADSGKALKLRQARTLLKKAGKDRMAIEAIKNAYAVAMAWEDGANTVADYRPEVKLANGLPRDDTEIATEAVQWTQSGSISLEEQIRMRRPDWSPDEIAEEIDRIENGPQPQTSITKRQTDRAILANQLAAQGTLPDQAVMTSNGSPNQTQ